MKKFLSIALALVMSLSLLTACGSKNQTPAETPAETPVEEKTDVKIGFIFLHDENSTYDLNFMNGAKEAIAAMGLSDDQYVMRTNIPEGQECYDAAC